MDDTADFAEKLRAVFDLCDAERQGFITVEHFVELAWEYFGAENDQVNVVHTCSKKQGSNLHC